MESTASKLEEGTTIASLEQAVTLPISVVIAARNEERNLPRCLASLKGVGQIYVIDSQSADATAVIAERDGAQVIQFHYQGGWPKKRQWALDTLSFSYEWILLLDADEALTPELREEIQHAIDREDLNGFYIALQMQFLGRRLRHCGAQFYKLSLFRKGKARFECRLKSQDATMCDMEVHEHVVVAGATEKLKNPIVHHNIESLSRYIQKHNEYSNWDARVWTSGNESRDLPPTLFGNQAQRRRWLRKKFFTVPGSPAVLFFYRFIFRLGFLDGVPGLFYCAFQAIQMFHIKAKIYESQVVESKG